MFRYRIIPVLLVLAAASPAMAVDTLQVRSPDPMLEDWRWTAFDRSSGLDGRVRDIFEDRDGNIWFATEQGAQRYDGVQWTTYTTEDGLAHNQVRTVIQTRDGAMWFGTAGGGVSRFDGEVWTTYTTDDGLATNFMHWRGLVQARDGSLWAGCWDSSASPSDTTGTRGGISRFDGQTWVTVDGPGGAPRPDIFEAHETSDGSLWFTTRDRGLLRFGRSGWTRYTTEDGLAGNRTLGVLKARDGSLWVGFWGGVEGISRFDGKGWRTYTVRDGLPEGVTFNILWQTEDGTVWAGSNSGGVLCRFDGKRWKPYASEEIPQLTGNVGGQPARDGTVWMWDWGRDSAFRFDPKGDWTVYTHPDSLFGGVEAADGSVWFHTRRSAVRYRDGLWVAHTPDDGFLDGEVVAVFPASSGSLWFIGTHSGMSAVARYDRDGWRIYTEQDGLVEWIYQERRFWMDYHSAVLEARDGSLWVGGQHNGRAAVCRFDGQTWTRYTEADGLDGEWITHPYEATDGTFWFGSRLSTDSGVALFRFDGQAWTRYTEADGLSSTYIYGMTEWPAGTLWVGTEAGISRLDLSARPGEQTWWNKVDFQVRRPKVRKFLPTEDALWFAFQPNRSAGAVRYDGEEWRIFTEADGLVDGAVNTIVRGADGALWFATRDGLGRFDGEYWSRYTEFAPLLGSYPILRAMGDGSFWLDNVEGKVIHFRYRSGQDAPETVLEPAAGQVSSAGNILLKWSGRDVWNQTPPRELRYQWRMDGKDWSPWSGRTDFTFTSLASGSHRFEVRAMDRNGNVAAAPAVHAFLVEGPWWKNPWVAGLTVVLMGLVGIQTGRIVQRDRRLQESNAALSAGNKELYGLNRDLQQKTEDLDKSNRELITEAALERVRAQAQGMQKSEDLSPLASEFTDELKNLGISFFGGSGASICIMNEEAKALEAWLPVQQEQVRVVPLPYAESFEFSWIKGMYEAWKNQDGDAGFEISPEEGDRYAHYWHRKSLEAYPDISRQEPEPIDGSIWVFSFDFPQGYMCLWTTAPLSDTDRDTIRRFTDVFAFAYTRFLELQEAEAQARDAERRAAVDRVRAETAEMRESQDIADLLAVLWEAVLGVGMQAEALTLNVEDPAEDILHIYAVGAQSWEVGVGLPAEKILRVDETRGVSLCKTEVSLTSAREWGWAIKEFEPNFWEAPDNFHEQMTTIWDVEFLESQTNQAIGINVPFDYGGIFVARFTGAPAFTETDMQTLRQFADAVSMGFTRFFDFQQLETQNRAMSEANKDLFQANQALQRDRAVERIRGEVQAMEQASDFERVLSVLAEDLKTVGLSFDTCGIEVLDEPVDEPTMAYLEGHGFRYTAYTIDPDGTVTSNSYHIPAPFPPVVLETLERFVAGEPWQGRSGQTAIVEVPASSYGRLRITSSNRPDFTEEDIDALQDFASAIALGYARYLDIREIQEQTKRKSRFLASMSHELRTPMNAIIGFSRLIRRRAGHLLPERHQENLGKIQHSANHLLDLINGILDLSKIEAGRMDVEAKPFDVKTLIAGCCGEVEPLVEARPDVKLTYEVADGIGEANTDQGRVRQIVINLLSNAIKFTDRGEVAVRVSQDGQADGEKSLVIAVSDTGTGIPSDALESIFEEFQQVKGSDKERKGTGLGLPITKGFAELLGGSISVQSEVGKGSTFTVRVPVAYSQA